jgi:hypothetical protein
MRRLAPLIAGATACFALVSAAPAGACATEKERYTAGAEFQNATYLFTGQTGDALSGALSGGGKGLQTFVSTFAGGAQAYAAATQRYLSVMAQPDCRRAAARRHR